MSQDTVRLPQVIIRPSFEMLATELTVILRDATSWTVTRGLESSASQLFFTIQNDPALSP